MHFSKQNLPIVNHDHFWGLLFHSIFNFWVGSSTSFEPRGIWLRFFSLLFVFMLLSYVNFLKLCPIDVEGEFSLLSLNVVTPVLGPWCKLSYENESMQRVSQNSSTLSQVWENAKKGVQNNPKWQTFWKL
jgi:hypothetical protein